MYKSKNFDYLLGLEGLSDSLLKMHFNLYEGYIKNINKLDEILVSIEKDGKYDTPEFAELNRRLGWEFNGMRLHELYFENLTNTKKELSEDSKIMKKIKEEFGSFEFWKKDFESMGLMRGVGWVVLFCDCSSSRLFNVWINEHDVGHLVGAKPLIIMDIFEHAFITDFGLKRIDYIKVFLNNIDWGVVESRVK